MRLIREIKDRTGKTVFKRWLLLRTPWFSIFIHGMYDRRGDQDAHCHDHPWNFWSLILWGGYFEVVHDTVNHHYGVRHPGSVQYMPARGIYHRVIELNRSRSYSLVVASRETVPWGYWTQDGWIENQQYRQLKRDGKLPVKAPTMSKGHRGVMRRVHALLGRCKGEW
jgi:hypothetical protein